MNTIRYKYIYMSALEEKPKTKVYGVYNIKTRNLLGKIGWYSSWRQYVFAPVGNTLYSVGCLIDIKNFIDEIELQRLKALMKLRDGR